MIQIIIDKSKTETMSFEYDGDSIIGWTDDISSINPETLEEVFKRIITIFKSQRCFKLVNKHQ